MNCAASKALLTLYVLNDLDDATAATVRSHLEECPDCRAALREIDTTLGLLRDALAAPTATPVQLATAQRARVLDRRTAGGPVVVSGLNWFTQHHRALAAAAAAVVVVGVLFLAIPHRRLSSRSDLMVEVADTEAFVDSFGDIEPGDAARAEPQ